jgi:Phytanoyl-CoA dioxygenase (PhyH)
MRFLTGSHRADPLGRFGRRADGAKRAEDVLDTYPEVTERYPIAPPLDLYAGDVTVHDALTVHSAPENETDSIRWVYSIACFPAETLEAAWTRTEGGGSQSPAAPWNDQITLTSSLTNYRLQSVGEGRRERHVGRLSTGSGRVAR